MFDAQYDVLWWAFGALVVLTILLVRMGVRLFNREQLLGKEIDELNLVASARRLWQMTWNRRPVNERRSPWQYYREEVLGQFRRLSLPMALVAIWMIAAFFIGRQAATIYRIPDNLLPNIDWYTEISSFLLDNEILGIESLAPIFLQNIRTLFVGSLMATFTFGIGIILILMTPFVLIGYLVVTMAAAGMDQALLMAAFIPHSIFEIPAALLAGATAVRLGMSVLAQPADGALTGQWMRTLADCIRLWVMLILPLLVLAAATEVLITPQIVMQVVGGA